ncbi:MAG: hypothetical protein ACP5OG_02635 [Candidatus Nanoarchaeia archaeon]
MEEKKLTTEEIYKLIRTENEKQFKNYGVFLEKIMQESPSFVKQNNYVKLEDNVNYKNNMPQKEVYSELARLMFNTLIFPYSMNNSNYLKSALPKYDLLIPLIKNESIKEMSGLIKNLINNRINLLEKEYDIKKDIDYNSLEPEKKKSSSSSNCIDELDLTDSFNELPTLLDSELDSGPESDEKDYGFMGEIADLIIKHEGSESRKSSKDFFNNIKFPEKKKSFFDRIKYFLRFKKPGK